jgi:hypothetical protein
MPKYSTDNMPMMPAGDDCLDMVWQQQFEKLANLRDCSEHFFNSAKWQFRSVGYSPALPWHRRCGIGISDSSQPKGGQNNGREE